MTDSDQARIEYVSMLHKINMLYDDLQATAEKINMDEMRATEPSAEEDAIVLQHCRNVLAYSEMSARILQRHLLGNILGILFVDMGDDDE